MIHYVYRLTYKKSSKMKHYIGKRSAEYLDIGKQYFTSSKILKNFFKNNTSDFKIKIVKICKTCEEALAFERKYLLKVKASQSEKFFNMCNGGSNGKPDNTGIVYAIDKKSGIKVSVDKNYYNLHKEEFIKEKKTLYKDKENNIYLCTKEFALENNLVGINKGFVYAKKDGKYVKIPKEYYHKNKNEFENNMTNKVICFNTISKKFEKVSKEEFDKNDYYKGANFYSNEIYKICEYCKKKITIQNIERHKNVHENAYFWITDNFNIFKCKQNIFYKKYQNDFKIIDKEYKKLNNFKVPLNGQMKDIRLVCKLRKNFLIED